MKIHLPIMQLEKPQPNALQLLHQRTNNSSAHHFINLTEFIFVCWKTFHIHKPLLLLLFAPLVPFVCYLNAYQMLFRGTWLRAPVWIPKAWVQWIERILMLDLSAIRFRGCSQQTRQQSPIYFVRTSAERTVFVVYNRTQVSKCDMRSTSKKTNESDDTMQHFRNILLIFLAVRVFFFHFCYFSCCCMRHAKCLTATAAIPCVSVWHQTNELFHVSWLFRSLGTLSIRWGRQKRTHKQTAVPCFISV